MNPRRPPGAPTGLNGQRGATLAITLIAVVLLMLTAAAIVRSVDTSTLLARNASFQRDAVNRSELVMRRAMREFENVAGRGFAQMANTATDAAGLTTGLPYRASALPADSQGIPLVLKNDAQYAAMFGSIATSARVDSGEGMSTIYVIERMCSLQQAATSTHCAPAASRAPDNCSRCTAVQTFAPVFRVTARTSGPRGTEAFTQVLFALSME